MAQIQTTELEDFKLKVSYVADQDVVASKSKEAVSNLRSLKIPGFRPGKATDQAIKFKFKDKINAWVKSEMINHANDDIVFETKIKPLGQIQVDFVKLEGTNFKLEAVYNKKPEFDPQYKDIEIPEPHLTLSLEEKTNEFIQTLREKHGDVSPFGEKDFVQEGDKVTIEYTLTNGTSREITEDSQVYEVGSGLFEGFDDSIIGMFPGESRKFNLTVNGETVVCDVTVHMGLKRHPCPLDETLAQRCGVTSLDEVTNSCKHIAENQLKTERTNKIAEQLKLKLLELNQFEVPQWLLNEEVDFHARQQGVKFADLDESMQEIIRQKASDNIRFTFIVDAIKDKEPETVLSDDEAARILKRDIESRGNDAGQTFSYLSKSGQLQSFIERIKSDYAVQWLVERVKVVA